MEKYKYLKYLETEVNEYIKHNLKDENDILVLNRLKVHPREFDIIVFDKITKYLYNFEIKRDSWKELLDQCIINKSYFHFCYAIISNKLKYDKTAFIENGIGIIEYSEKDNELHFKAVNNAKYSESINIFFKKRVWQIFHNKFGDGVNV
jgi:hypothetical protein